MTVRNQHQCRGAAGGVSFIFLSKMCSVNHPFRLDSQRFLSYSIHMRVLTLAVTPAHSKSILGYDLFLYRLSHRRKSVIKTVPGKTLHCERGGLTTTRGCLFGFVRKKTAHAREINGEKSSQRASRFSLRGWWEYKPGPD